MFLFDTSLPGKTVFDANRLKNAKLSDLSLNSIGIEYLCKLSKLSAFQQTKLIPKQQ